MTATDGHDLRAGVTETLDEVTRPLPRLQSVTVR